MPILKGLCSLKELKDGTYNLEDLFELNEMIFVQRYIENESLNSQNKQNEKSAMIKDYKDKMRGIR